MTDGGLFIPCQLAVFRRALFRRGGEEEFKQAIGIEGRRGGGGEKGEGQPIGGKEGLVVVAAFDGFTGEDGRVEKVTFVDQHDLMTGLAFVGKDVFEQAEIAIYFDVGVDFFAQFTDDGFGTAFAELDAATEGAVEGVIARAIMPLRDEDAPFVPEDTKGQRANFTGFQVVLRRVVIGCPAFPEWRDR